MECNKQFVTRQLLKWDETRRVEENREARGCPRNIRMAAGGFWNTNIPHCLRPYRLKYHEWQEGHAFREPTLVEYQRLKMRSFRVQSQLFNNFNEIIVFSGIRGDG